VTGLNSFSRSLRFFRWPAAFLATALLIGCGEKEPIRIGFIGPVSGRNADLGAGGRNGVQLAVEQANAAGGVNGRKIELIFKDDQGSVEIGKREFAVLLAEKPEAIIGPMTSGMAQVFTPLANEAQILIVAPTATTNELAGKDDYFFRTIATTRQHAKTMAKYLIGREVHRVSLLVEQNNRAYTESWSSDFKAAFEPLGGVVLHAVQYVSSGEVDFVSLSRELDKSKPDAIILVTSGVDAALVINQLDVQGSKALRVTSEWAGSGKLIELGGDTTNGAVVPQYFDPSSTLPAFVAFREAYRTRFQEMPGFPGVNAYNATRVVLAAIKQRQGNVSLKSVILAQRRYEGLLEPIEFDDFGDVQSRTYITTVKNGRYVVSD
jgi:branched-chain amino acid transport system substrate-binding protein